MKGLTLSYFSSTNFMFVLVCLIVTMMIFESTFTKISYYSAFLIPEQIGKALFGVTVAVCIFTQALIFNFIKSLFTRNEIDKYLGLRWLGTGIRIVWYCLSFLLILLLVQMLVTSKYTGILLVIETGISYGLAAVLLIGLGFKLFSWFKSRKNGYLFIYAVSVIFLAINLVITYLYVFNILIAPWGIGGGGEVIYHQGKISSYSSYNPLLQSLFSIFTALSFVSMWISTAVFMRHYSKRLGRVKYWVLVCLPLIYFLGQFQSLILDLFEDYRQEFPVTFGIGYTLFFSLSQPGGGILFGVAFWSLARSFKTSPDIRNLLYALGLGLLVFFSANQIIVLVNYPFPPFGAASVSYLPLASYLILLGIYGSALIAAHDANIRQLIRKSVSDQAKLLEFMGSALKEEEIYKKVIAATTRYEKTFTDQVGIGSSLTDEEVKKYLEEVIQDVKLRSYKDKNLE